MQKLKSTIKYSLSAILLICGASLAIHGLVSNIGECVIGVMVVILSCFLFSEKESVNE